MTRVGFYTPDRTLVKDMELLCDEYQYPVSYDPQTGEARVVHWNPSIEAKDTKGLDNWIRNEDMKKVQKLAKCGGGGKKSGGKKKGGKKKGGKKKGKC